MQLNEIVSFSEDQERGRWFELSDPVTAKPTGIRLRIVGPDSETQRRGRLRLADDLADLADEEGRVSAEARDRVRVANLGRCVIDWEIAEEGEPVPFSHANVVRLLKAAAWVQAQVDAFAGDRASFRKPA